MTARSDELMQMNFRIHRTAHELLQKLADHEEIPLQDLMGRIVGHHLAREAELIKVLIERSTAAIESELHERSEYLLSLSDPT